jgi:hypothetical protein
MTKREVSPLKKHIEESPKIRALKEKRLRRRKRVIIFFSVLFVLLVGGFVFAARHPRFLLVTVHVTGNKVIDTDAVTTEVEKYLSGNYAYVIPHRNAFMYPKVKIVAGLAAKFPRFKTVAVYRTDFKTLQVDVTEVKGRALWCGTDATIVSPTAQCYFTDETGKIVSLAPQYSGNVYPRFFGGTIAASDTNPLGKTFIDETPFQNLLTFQTKIESFGYHVKGLLIGTGEEDTFVLDLGAGKTALVRFIKTDDYHTLVANLTAAFAKPEFATMMKTQRQNLQYFDLRFTNKVYYKFDDPVVTTTAPIVPVVKAH